MSSEKAQKKTKTTIQVNRNRGGGKKRPDLFAHLRNVEHPLDSLLPAQEVEALDTPINFDLDTQNSNLNTPKNEDSGHSENFNLGTQAIKLEHSNSNFLDTQKQFSEHPKKENLDTFAPKTEIRTPKKDKDLSANTPKEKNLDTQKKYDYRKYDANRSTVRVNIHLHKDIDQRVREYCVKARPRLELKEFFEIAALQFLDTQNKTPLGANAPLDDRRSMIYKTSSRIINLYRELTGNVKWKINDDAKAFAYNEINLKFIELGMLHTLGNKQGGGKINSFAYFIPEIENWSTSGLDEKTIEGLIKHYRQRLGVK